MGWVKGAIYVKGAALLLIVEGTIVLSRSELLVLSKAKVAKYGHAELQIPISSQLHLDNTR